MNQWTSLNVVIGQVAANKWVGALKTRPAAALLATGKLRLSKDPAFGPTQQSTLAELEANEADFSGYPAGGIAVSITDGLNISPTIQGAMTSGTFEAATATPFIGNAVTGYWIDDGTDPVTMEAFPNAQTADFSSVGDFLVLNAVLPMNLLQRAAPGA